MNKNGMNIPFKEEAEMLNGFLKKTIQGTIVDYLKKKSVEIDNYILGQEKTENISFITGEISLNYSKDDEFYTSIDLYFKSKSGEWINKKIKGKPTKLEWEFTAEEQDKIVKNGSLSFEYEKPVNEPKK